MSTVKTLVLFIYNTTAETQSTSIEMLHSQCLVLSQHHQLTKDPKEDTPEMLHSGSNNVDLLKCDMMQ